MSAVLLCTIVALSAWLVLTMLNAREAFTRGYKLGALEGSRDRCENCNAAADTCDTEGVPLCRLCAALGDEPVSRRREVFVPDPLTGGEFVPMFSEASYPPAQCTHGVSMLEHCPQCCHRAGEDVG